MTGTSLTQHSISQALPQWIACVSPGATETLMLQDPHADHD